MSTEQNKALARRFIEEVWNQGNLAVIDELIAADYVFHVTTPVRGRGESKRFVSFWRSAVPDIHFTIEDEIAEGDRVVQRFTERGTQRGDMPWVAATGKPYAVSGMNIFRIEHGQLVEAWGNVDLLGMLQQLGVIPAPEVKGVKL